MKKTLLSAFVLTIAMPILAYANSSNSEHNMANMKMPMKIEKKSKMGMGVGVVNSINHTNRTMNISHGAIKALRWPAMTMNLAVSENIDLKSIKVNDKIKFHIVLGADKIFRITTIMDAESTEHKTMENSTVNEKTNHNDQHNH